MTDAPAPNGCTPAAQELAAQPSRNGCDCDFCSGRKKWSDNWCARCAEVRMLPPKWHENLDVCDECERQMTEERALEGLALVERGGAAPHDLTFAAEALGGLSDAPRAIHHLLILAKHTSPIVREGAVYGMSRFAGESAVAVTLRELAANDPSPGIRQAASEALDA